MSRADYMFSKKPMASALLFLLISLSLGCVDLAEPWQRTAPTDGSAGGSPLLEAGPDIRNPGTGGISPVSSGPGGTAGTFGAGGSGGTGTGGTGGGVASITGGTGGSSTGGGVTGGGVTGGSGTGRGGTGGGTGGSGTAGGSTGGNATGGSGTGLGGIGGSSSEGSGTGRGSTGGSSSGGSSTGGNSTGGSATGGSGTGRGSSGGSSTGGSSTGGSSTGGSATGGSSSTGGSSIGGSGTGGATNVVTSGLVAYYPCDQTAGPKLTDLSGNGHHADLMTGTGSTGGYTFGTGPKTGLKNALRLVKSSQGYVSIPQGALNNQTTAMTIATWLYLSSSADWPRVWDFGTGPTFYMFFTPRTSMSPNSPRFAITKTGYATGGEQHLNGIDVLSIGEWHHVAVVLGSGGGTLYIDGKPVNANSGMTLRPADLGTTTNNYIGRSQFAEDPYLDASIDDFRVYNRALSATEIQTLFAWTGP